VVVVSTRNRADDVELLVAPVTTRAPAGGVTAVEIPPRVRAHLGLPEARCWIVADELNRFAWPGPDLRPIRRGDRLDPFYGSIPAALFEQLRAAIRSVAQAGRLRSTSRTD
jgi:hypothetical protein